MHGQGRDGKSVEAAGDGRPFLKHRADDAAERQRGDREIQSAHAQGRPADRRAADRGEQSGHRHRHQERHALRQQNGVGVSADAEKRRVAKADQAGIADQQHQPDAGDGENEHPAEFADVKFAHDKGDDQQNRDQQSMPEQIAAVMPRPDVLLIICSE